MGDKNSEPSATFAKTLSQKNCDVSQAVTEFRKHIHEASAKKPEDVEDAIWSSWKEYFKVVAMTKPEEQDHLVQFLLQLRKGDGQGKKLKIEETEQTLSNLPGFGPEMRYVWNDTPNEKSSPELAQAWINFNAFAARITAESKPDDCMDYSLYCIWSLRSALEDAASEEKITSAILKAAAMWMIYAAREIHQRVVDEQTYDGRMAIGGRDVDGKEWKGHSKERWQAWYERFEKRKDGAGDEEMKRVIGEALEKMRQVQG
ncbi:hypothetical protein VTL71DRAFT_9937 [Oculimacula yallundae]|uniref:Uncharacterized protein n=1 Tax=Oculimacula yallundae TaxID=86028 RepID=A0ABR4BQZ7_9HELO